MIKKIFCAAALLLPTLFLAGVVVQRLNELEAAPTVRLPIAGYDPVDILHGHYLQFRFDPRVLEPELDYYQLESGNYCVCLNPSSAQAGKRKVGSYQLCRNKKELKCEMWASSAEFFSRPQKFFIDERYALQLDRLVREASAQVPFRLRTIENTLNPNLAAQQQQAETETPPRVTIDVAVSKSGALRLKMLYIDNKPWQEVIATKKE